MNNLKISKMMKAVTAATVKHIPELLIGVGIAGMFTAVVMSAEATPKAVRLIEEEKEKRNHAIFVKAKESGAEKCEHIAKLKPMEIVQTTWKCYIPTAITFVASAACLIGAHSVSAKRSAVLATAYSLSETALSEYQNKVTETIGEKKEREIRDEIAKDHVNKDPVSKSEVIITEKGTTLCYDNVCGRYFKSDIDKIRQIINELNRRLMSEMYISLNEFYYELGLKSTEMGEDLGWNADDGFIEVDFSSTLADDGTPCLVVNYNYAPRWDYRDLH